MDLTTVDDQKKLALSDSAFAKEYNESLVHQAVVAYLAGARSGTKAQKNRSAVSGGGAKPWRQKGTGRARAGTIRSPIWRSGGATFAATPRDHKQKLNKKMVRAAYASIFSELLRQDRLKFVSSFTVSEPKTKQALKLMESIGVKSALVITAQADINLYLSVRNLHNIDVTEVGGVDPVSLLKFEHVIVTTEAAKQIEEWLA